MTDLEGLLLAIVRDHGPCHGLAVAEEAEERTGRRIGVGSLYKALHRLEREGLLSAYWEDRASEPAHRGPQRRYYEMTGAGADALSDHAARVARALGLRVEPA